MTWQMRVKEKIDEFVRDALNVIVVVVDEDD
jgi:hypothetical protein